LDLLHCAATASVDWLKTLKILEVRECKNLEEVDFPREYVFTMYSLRSVDMPTKQVLGRIQRPKEGLFIANWNVLTLQKRRPVSAQLLRMTIPRG
jgi:Domain of unknown function (DUF4780)